MKLNQVIAIEKGTKAKVQADVDTTFKAVQKPTLFDGFTKTYRKRVEDEEDVPPQRQNVQMVAALALKQITERWQELYDVTAQKDYANCKAIADVVVDGKPLLKDVPVTYLLFLEKQLTDLYTIVGKFPVLDPAEQWVYESATGLHKTEATLTTRTKKVQKGIVLYPHSAEHPAQTQLITEDVSVGTWEAVKTSGAMPAPERHRLLLRIIQLQQAVKSAREEANMIDAPIMALGQKVFGWILAS